MRRLSRYSSGKAPSSYLDNFARNIRIIGILQAIAAAINNSLHTLSSVLAFIVYGTNHSLDPAIIFTSLALFNLLRVPLMCFCKLLHSSANHIMPDF